MGSTDSWYMPLQDKKSQEEASRKGETPQTDL
jgi:hypothetical protein